MPARVARKGSTRLLVPIADSRQLDNLAPNNDTLLSLGSELGAEGFFVFALNRNSDQWLDRISHVLSRARHPRGPGQRQCT